ncbi:response regulator transcription factor [Ethanoligenens sp.]|uniref:response regulator transcription factor n=1 Tax=Ethanoligenens sp. TaxID=2099655 RepID=UPI0039ED79EA
MDYDCLIVDDEEALAQSTCEYFNLFELKTAWVSDTPAALTFLRQHTVAVLLLDINLPSDSGFALCKHLRRTSDIPILFISARTSDDDQILALGIGGDDYIQKPYSLSVLLAKVKAVIKRRRAAVSSKLAAPVFTCGTLVIDFSASRVMKQGVPLPLKTMEYKLLAYLVQNRGRVIPKEELFRHVWEDAVTGDGTLNVHIRRLREKMEDDPNHPVYIQTVWGTGYRFEENTP